MSTKLTESELNEIHALYGNLLNYSSDSLLDPIDPMTYRSSDGDTLLHIAVLRGDDKTVSILLKAGFDPNALGDMGSTPLHYAYDAPNEPIVKLLLDHGARTDIVDDLGDRPKP
jgi:ankyrin repeat protein